MSVEFKQLTDDSYLCTIGTILLGTIYFNTATKQNHFKPTTCIDLDFYTLNLIQLKLIKLNLEYEVKAKHVKQRK